MNKRTRHADSAQLLSNAAQAASDAYADHLQFGGSGDQSEEAWIDALIDGANSIMSLDLLIKELDAAKRDMQRSAHCDICAHHVWNGGVCFGLGECGQHKPRWTWRGA